MNCLHWPVRGPNPKAGASVVRKITGYTKNDTITELRKIIGCFDDEDGVFIFDLHCQLRNYYDQDGKVAHIVAAYTKERMLRTFISFVYTILSQFRAGPTPCPILVFRDQGRILAEALYRLDELPKEQRLFEVAAGTAQKKHLLCMINHPASMS